MATKAKHKKEKSLKTAKEVNRILKSNLRTGDLAKEDVFFAKKFLNVILEADNDLPSVGDASGLKDTIALSSTSGEASPDQFTATQNQTDFENSLEDGTPKDAFDIEGAHNKDAESFSNIYVKKCHKWVDHIEKFAKFLNDTDDSSLNTQLNDADRDGSVFKGITRKIGDNIAKTAGELSRIAETLKKAIADAPKKQRELQKLTKIS